MSRFLKVQKKVRTPKCAIFLILSFSIFTEWPLMTFIILGWLPSLFAAKSIEIYLKQMKVLETL